MAKTLISSEWIREIHREGSNSLDRYTFCGALEYCYNHIAYLWNDETRRKHEREYDNIILPALRSHNEKTIRDYTKDDYEEAIEAIREKGYEQNGVRQQYAESSIHNYQNLIYYVVRQASVYGLCDNVLWGSRFTLDEADEKQAVDAETVQKKSLSVEQEKRFAKEVLTDISGDGAAAALLLMWGLGLRNAEACGLNYGDIKPLEGHPEVHAAWIYKSTKINSSELQSGGKTYNTGRIVPMPARLVDFLERRRKLVMRQLSELNNKDVSVDDLPICCDGSLNEDAGNCLKRCSANKVTAAAGPVFEKAGITSRQIAYLDAELSRDNTAAILKEKEPTAYLLRRNFATQMSILGLSVSEMQYLIGHDVEDAYESRNEYVDSDRIFEMAKKLRNRVLLNQTDQRANRTELRFSGKKTVKMHLSAKEPGDALRITISPEEQKTFLKMSWFEEVAVPNYDRTVNVLKE